MAMAETNTMKMTEIGPIPQEWDALPLSDIGNFSKGAGITREQANSGNLPCVRYGEIYTTHDNYIRAFYSHISPELAKTATRLKTGDILFAGSGETKEEIGKAVSFIGEEEAYAGGDIIILSPKVPASSLYLGFVLNDEASVRQKSSMGQGDAVVHIHAKELANVVVPFPHPTEQKHIAEVLQSIDTLIAELDKVVSKKRLMKQGAMQQLLTGKVRVKGFSTPWIEVELRQTGVMKSGGTPSTLVPEYWNGDINWLQSGAVQNCYIYPSAVSQKITELGLSKSAAYLISHDSVLIALTGATCANVGYLTFDSAANQSVVSIEPYPEYSAKFLYQLLLTKRDLILQNRGGSAQGGVTLNQLKGITVTLPRDLEEQVEIAAILSAMDNEIAALEAERDKYKNIKQGMMQKLLTGQIRLPV